MSIATDGFGTIIKNDVVTGVNPAVLAQTDWWIDPQNVSGLASNANSGADATHPLLNQFQVLKLWGVGNVVWNSGGVVTFHYLSVPTAVNDTFDISSGNVTFGQAMSVIVNGPAPTIVTNGGTGAFTGVTALDRTSGTTAGGSKLTLTDTGATWTKGQRITITSGPRATASGWVTVTASGTTTFTPFFLPYPINTATLVQVTPVIGDPYKVETGFGAFPIAGLNTHSLSQFPSASNRAIVFRNVLPQGRLSVKSSISYLSVIFDGCPLTAVIEECDFITLSNCFTTGSVLGIIAQAFLISGGYISSVIIARAGSSIQLDNDLVVGGGISLFGQGTNLYLGNVGFFGEGAAGDALTIAPGTMAQIGPEGAAFTPAASALYGNGFTGYGVRIRVGGRLLYNGATHLPTIVGTSGQFVFPSGTYAYFDTTARTFPLATAGTPNTWSNLVAAQPGGFGSGNAHDPDFDAHILTFA